MGKIIEGWKNGEMSKGVSTVYKWIKGWVKRWGKEWWINECKMKGELWND